MHKVLRDLCEKLETLLCATLVGILTTVKEKFIADEELIPDSALKKKLE